ncbi:MAG TPA: DUF1583 domain-containing protein [Thermoguttaceae bacterium]|nr:DUF1583 domain-containing protein [Thermoguttaceae bacterium]
MAERWFCKVLGREMGPLGFEDLMALAHSGTLAGGDAVRAEGTGEWTAAREVPGLFAPAESEPAAASRAALTAPPDPSPADDAPDADSPSADVGGRPACPMRFPGTRALIAGAIAVALLAIVAGFAWRLARGSPEDPDAPATLDERFTQDFRERFLPQAFELVGGWPPRRFWKVEPEGLRLTLEDRSDLNYCAVSPRIVVKGDFEITAGFTILDLPKPTQGFGAGMQISVEEEQGERAAVQRVHRQREGHSFSAYRGRLKEDATYDHSSRMQPAGIGAARSGWLRLRRQGTKLLYEVGDPDGQQFTQIDEQDFPVGDVAKLRLALQTGGSPTRGDVVWTHLDVRAEKLARLYEPPKPSAIWRRLLVGLVAVLLAGAAGLGVWAWVARRAYFRSALSADRASTT